MRLSKKTKQSKNDLDGSVGVEALSTKPEQGLNSVLGTHTIIGVNQFLPVVLSALHIFCMNTCAHRHLS